MRPRKGPRSAGALALTTTLLAAAGRAVVPWKNGAGITHRLAISPPDADWDTLDWQVSIAEIRRPGPFSVYPGIDRLFAIVDGQVELSIAGRDPMRLTVESAPIAFPGEAAVTSAGIAQALNVMIRRGRYGARATRRSSSTYCRSAVAIVLALQPLEARYGGHSFRLAANDALMIDTADGNLTTLSAHPDFYLIEIDPGLARSAS